MREEKAVPFEGKEEEEKEVDQDSYIPNVDKDECIEYHIEVTMWLFIHTHMHTHTRVPIHGTPCPVRASLSPSSPLFSSPLVLLHVHPIPAPCQHTIPTELDRDRPRRQVHGIRPGTPIHCHKHTRSSQ